MVALQFTSNTNLKFEKKKCEIIYIHIPKTAGYTIGRCLRDVGCLKDGYGFSHNIAKEIIKKEDKNCIIMSVVRNPYDRLYSIYEFYKKKRNGIIFEETFESFIMNFEKKYYKKYPQFDTLCNFLTDEYDKLMPTDIIRFENLKKEYDVFCKKYNIDNNLIERNKNELKDNDICWSNLYTEEMQKIVNEIFKKDFETFNYSYLGFLNSKGIH